MKKFIGFLLCLIGSIAVAGNLPVYTESNRMIMQNANQPKFIIRLKSNPTTGYSWFLKSYDKNFITMMQHQYISPKNGLIGAGGVEQWTFQLTKEAFLTPHRFAIALAYIRPWETKQNDTGMQNSLIFQVITNEN